MTRPQARPKHAPHAPRTPFVLLLFGLIAGGLFALLALNTASAANEVRRSAIAGQDQSVAARVEQLQVEAHDSAAPQNLARSAEALGMIPAGNAGFVVIGKNGQVQVLKGAQPATESPVFIPPASPAKPSPTKTPSKTTSKTPSTTKTPTKSASKTASKTASKSASTTASKTPSTSASTTASRTASRTPTPTETITLGAGG